MKKTGAEDGRRRADRVLLARYRATGDPADRDAVVERFLPLARRLARRYEHSDEPFDDLVQVAALGLVKAVERFDPARDIAFSSYAVPTILGELKRHFRDRTWSIRVPRDLQELSLKVDRTVGELWKEQRSQPSVGEVAARLGVSAEEVLEAMEASGAYRASSLDAPRAAGDEEAGETVGDAFGSEESGFLRAEERVTLELLMRVLTAREREVLRLRFAHDLTQAEIGELVGVSQMQVSRIIRQALARLRAVAGAPQTGGEQGG
ncbi:MAG TPA: SigB/SigF/SigG family RNA polymerase sigma factor [Solirubrobacteraceae bacterium]|nr:SigB/SigF/SigG family RNA polymerase sigma factor [Solirubrobacteraceae bacterium]